MAGSNKNLNHERLVSELLERVLSEKHREVVARRFGIGRDQKETLEEIGQSHNITRERVRQIEAAALETLKQNDYLEILSPVRESVKSYIDERGFVVPERKLLADFASPAHHPSFLFILTISPEFHFFQEDERFHSSWATDTRTWGRVSDLLQKLHSHLEEQKDIVAEGDFQKILAKEARDRNLHQFVQNYLDIIKTIQKTPEGRYGLSHWPQVTPKGVKDKSYIVLKKRGEPLHFREISDLINVTTFSSLSPLRRPAYPQTVHNELIKDERFVLVGRGTYALKEWGYEPGTVKEVIQRALQTSNGPLTKKEILKRVFEQRLVKENTILLNLQDKTAFRRLPSGEFVLVD